MNEVEEKRSMKRVRKYY